MSLRRAASFSLVAAGFAAGLAQVLLLRELLTVAYGNELSMGVLLASWLICGAMGSLLARRLVQPDEPDAAVARRLIVLAALPAPLLALGVLVARAGPALYSSVLPRLCPEGGCPLLGLIGGLALPPGEAMDLGRMVLLGLLAAAGPAALDGAQFAVGCDLFARSGADRKGLGLAYAQDAIGHLIGGVVLASVVVMALNPFAVACVAGLANLAAAWTVLRASLSQGRWPARAVYGGAMVAALLLILSGGLQDGSVRWRIFHQEMLASFESIYGNLTVTRQEPDGIYLYQSGVYSGASPPLVGTIDDLVHFALLQHPGPERVLMVGGGVMGGLTAVLRHDPGRVDYIELDASLFEIARKWAAPEDIAALSDPRVHARQGDGRRAMAASRGSEGWDAILVCLSDPSTAQINRFYTAEFYTQATAALREGGILAWEVPGSDGYFGPSLLRLHTCLLDTARPAFSRLVRLPGASTVYVGGSSDYLSDDWGLLEQRLHERGIEGTYLEAVLPEALLPWTLQRVEETLRAAPRQPLNRDLRPIGYFFDQAWWAEQFHPRSARLFALLSRLGPLHLLVPVLVVGLLLWALAPLGGVRGTFVPLSVAVTGLIAMGIELALLFAFQAIYGYVYHMVGVIVGAFMVGLAAGAVGVSRWLEGRPQRSARLGMVVTQLALAALAAGIALLLPALWASPFGWLQSAGLVQTLVGAAVVFPLLTALVGLGVGLQFPLATASWYDAGETPRAAAGLYAADLIGASIGALLGGALLAPVLGLPGTCYLAAALSALMALLLATRVGARD